MMKIVKLKTVNYKAIVFLVSIFLSLTAIGQLNAQEIDSSNPINRYSFNLYHKVKAENENLFLSPLSTYYALLSAYEGSKNQTKKAFENVLGLKNSEFSKNDTFYLLGITDSLSGLSVSNAVWLDTHFQIEDNFNNAVSSKYQTDIKNIDFNNTQQAVNNINDWVAQNTNQLIKDIISPSDVNKNTKLLISNIVYFKGEWLNAFKKSSTHKNVFFADSINHYRADFMNKTEKLAYFENEAFQFVAKPYKQSSLSFGMILPKDFFGLEAVENQLNDNLFNEILEKADTTNVWLSMPKIKLESKLKLKPVLKKMGLETMFTNEADFSGISPNDSLHFEQVMHKTHLDLNEEYTEAAAATVSNVFIRGIPKRKDFLANHPFMFFIFDNHTRTILFVGRFTKPQNAESIEEDDFSADLVQRIINEIRPNKRTSFSYTQPLTVIADGKELIAVDLNDIDWDDVEDMKSYKVDAIQLASKGYEGLIVISLKKDKIKKIKRKIIK